MNTVLVKALSDELGVAFGTSGVRGLVKDLTPAICFAFVRSFLQLVCPTASCVAIGVDLRPSSPDIAKACLLAVESFGAKVIYCDALPTPALAFYGMQNKMPAVMITGSHIPFDRNGIKFYRQDGEISKSDEAAIMNGQVTIPESISAQVDLLTLPIVNTSVIEIFKTRYTSLFPKNMLQGKRIGVYEHSSAARDVIKWLLVYFGADVISLERTDIFVPIDTEAVSAGDCLKGLNWAKEYQLDAIISTDGDGDRPLIADEKGEWLRGDILGVLCADYLNATHVVAPVNVNTVLELRNPDRACLRTKIGSPYVIAGMDTLLQEMPSACVVGYEANGGFLVGGDMIVNDQALDALPTRDSVLPALIVLALSYEQSCPVSELIVDFPKRYTASGRIQNIPIDISRQLISSIKASKAKQTELLSSIEIERTKDGGVVEVAIIDETDGLRMTLNNGGIVHLRPSGNAPELRCYVEAENHNEANKMLASILGHLSLSNV